MLVHNQRRHFHAAAPLFQPRLGLAAETADADLSIGLVRLLSRIKLGKLLLLGRDLDQQAFAQIPRPHAGRVKMLHQVDARGGSDSSA